MPGSFGAAPSLSAPLQQALDAAIATHRAGDPATAEGSYRHILDQVPAHAETRHLLAVARLQQGDAADADQQARQAIDTARQQGLASLLAKACNTRGNILAAVGQSAAALDLFAAAEQADPSFADGAFNQGTLLLSMDRLDDAITVFHRLLSRTPNHAGAVNNLGAALVKAGRAADAVAHYETALQSGGDRLLLGVNLASAQEMANRLSDAEASLAALEPLLAGQPLPATALMVRSRVARRRGNLSQALDDSNAALAHPLGDSDRIEALFNKGLILDQQQQACAAFAAFAEGNALVARQPIARQCDGAAYRRDIEKTRQWFTPTRLDSLSRRGERSQHGENVVFFVGFPRSGTTLMEQVLEAHPRLVTTMEDSPLERIRARLGMAYPDVVDRLDGQAGDRLRKAFFEAAEAVTDPLGERLVVDKLPLNIVNLGLAQALFPRARVLLALRDPRDCVLSCFMQNFRPNPAMVNFLTLESSAETYAQVMGLWLEQRDHLSLRHHTYRYEDLVGDFSPTVSAVLDFLGVGWDPAVEKYREKAQSREITTPSYRDVTAPLFTRAIGRWQLYAQDMAPVLPILQPFVDAFGYGADSI